MGNKGVVIPVDIYDKEGNMLKIEFNNPSGEHVMDALWDERDAQTSENRTDFRKWAYRQLEQQGYEVHK